MAGAAATFVGSYLLRLFNTSSHLKAIFSFKNPQYKHKTTQRELQDKHSKAFTTAKNADDAVSSFDFDEGHVQILRVLKNFFYVTFLDITVCVSFN